MKGATFDGVDYSSVVVVSIHAPNEGSDLQGFGFDGTAWLFQSTLPMKGAT